MLTEFFEKHAALLRLEMFTVMNEGLERWDPARGHARGRLQRRSNYQRRAPGGLQVETRADQRVRPTIKGYKW
jgi:hypothetical protein